MLKSLHEESLIMIVKGWDCHEIKMRQKDKSQYHVSIDSIHFLNHHGCQ